MLDLAVEDAVHDDEPVGGRQAGQLRPRYGGLRILQAAWIGRGGFVRNLLGTMRRLRRGANREAEPA